MCDCSLLTAAVVRASCNSDIVLRDQINEFWSSEAHIKFPWMKSFAHCSPILIYLVVEKSQDGAIQGKLLARWQASPSLPCISWKARQWRHGSRYDATRAYQDFLNFSAPFWYPSTSESIPSITWQKHSERCLSWEEGGVAASYRSLLEQICLSVRFSQTSEWSNGLVYQNWHKNA